MHRSWVSKRLGQGLYIKDRAIIFGTLLSIIPFSFPRSFGQPELFPLVLLARKNLSFLSEFYMSYTLACLQTKSHKNRNFTLRKSVIPSFNAFSLSPAFVHSPGPSGNLCLCVCVCIGSQVAERLGNRASNLKVASSIPGRAK